MTRRRTTLAGLDRALEHEHWKLGARLVLLARKAAEHGRTRAQLLARQEGLRASGTYERSFIIVDTRDGAILANAAKHAYFVERGRRAGTKPPPAAVILRWLMDKGSIKRIPVFGGDNGVAKIDKSVKGKARRIAVGERKEAISKRRTSKREAYIAACWRRAFNIARSIAKRGIRGKFIVGRATVDIHRFIRAELLRIRRGA